LSNRKPTELVRVGRVGRPHGTDGAFVVDAASEDPRRFQVGASIHVAGEPATVILSRRVGRGRRAIKLDRPAERGAELAVPRRALPEPAPGFHYVADLVGLRVVDRGGTELGRVRDVLPGPANDNLELDSGLLVPLIEDAVAEIDLETGSVVLTPEFSG
jgi:16S rRNA processing protein RimM